VLSSPDPLGLSFDLNDLDQHNFPIEHDASLSREDAYFGNDYSFNSHIWDQSKSFFKNGKTALLPAALAIANRTADSKARNPTFVYGLQQFILRYGEMGLAVQTMVRNLRKTPFYSRQCANYFCSMFYSTLSRSLLSDSTYLTYILQGRRRSHWCSSTRLGQPVVYAGEIAIQPRMASTRGAHHAP